MPGINNGIYTAYESNNTFGFQYSIYPNFLNGDLKLGRMLNLGNYSVWFGGQASSTQHNVIAGTLFSQTNAPSNAPTLAPSFCHYCFFVFFFCMCLHISVPGSHLFLAQKKQKTKTKTSKQKKSKINRPITENRLSPSQFPTLPPTMGPSLNPSYVTQFFVYLFSLLCFLFVCLCFLQTKKKNLKI